MTTLTFSRPIRVTGTSEEVFFVAKDLCLALGYKSTGILKYLDDELKPKMRVMSNKGVRDTRVVSEKALFRLLIWSEKETFVLRDWIRFEFAKTLLDEFKFDKRIPDNIKLEFNELIKVYAPIVEITYRDILDKIWYHTYHPMPFMRELKRCTTDEYWNRGENNKIE